MWYYSFLFEWQTVTLPFIDKSVRCKINPKYAEMLLHIISILCYIKQLMPVLPFFPTKLNMTTSVLWVLFFCSPIFVFWVLTLFAFIRSVSIIWLWWKINNIDTFIASIIHLWLKKINKWRRTALFLYFYKYEDKKPKLSSWRISLLWHGNKQWITIKKINK